jgi:hypothetical protein
MKHSTLSDLKQQIKLSIEKLKDNETQIEQIPTVLEEAFQVIKKFETKLMKTETTIESILIKQEDKLGEK